MTEKIDGWFVSVAVNGKDILTIGDNYLAGSETAEEFAPIVRACAAHLLSFIGEGPDHVGNHIALAARATAEQSRWQPIETAPMTGRTLLLGYPNALGNWRTVRGQWMTQEYIDQNWEEPDEAEAGWYETSVEADDAPSCWPITPTQWQPLPKPPTDAAIESQRSGDGS